MTIDIHSILTEDLVKDLEDVSIENVTDTEEEMAVNEHAKGFLNEKSIRLLGVMQILYMRSVSYAEESEKLLKGKDPDASKVAHVKSNEYARKFYLIEKIFQLQIIDDFCLWDKDGVGIRKGFTVVLSDEGNATLFPAPSDLH